MSTSARPRGIVQAGVVFTLVTLLFATLAEGFSSGVLFVASLRYRQATRPTFDDSLYTQHDEALGWVNRPGVFLPDVYGSGISLRTNAQGFRADHEYAPKPPSDRIRVVCSGDSMTLGYGVSNADTWCHQLELLDPRLETVNLGQAGYGIQQSYLRYRQQGVPLSPRVHVLAFIDDDLSRFHGSDRPVMSVNDGRLVVSNVPVPKPLLRGPKLDRIAESIRSLRGYQLVDAVMHRFGPAPEPVEQITSVALTERIFDQLAREDQSRSVNTVFVLLPCPWNFHNPPEWRDRLRTQLATKGIQFVDLIEDFNTLGQSDFNRMFFPKDHAGFAHFTVEGNALAAKWLYEKAVLPQLGDRSRPVGPDLHTAAPAPADIRATYNE